MYVSMCVCMCGCVFCLVYLLCPHTGWILSSHNVIMLLVDVPDLLCDRVIVGATLGVRPTRPGYLYNMHVRVSMMSGTSDACQIDIHCVIVSPNKKTSITGGYTEPARPLSLSAAAWTNRLPHPTTPPPPLQRPPPSHPAPPLPLSLPPASKDQGLFKMHHSTSNGDYVTKSLCYVLISVRASKNQLIKLM